MSRYRGNASTTLYVRNISDRVRYEDLRRFFSKYGKTLDVTIPLDYYSGMPKGYCFVEFEDPRDAEEAQYRMDRQRLFGREIEVEFARGDRKTPGEMRTRDRHGERRHGGGGRGGGRGMDYDRRSRSRSRDRGERRGGDKYAERGERGMERRGGGAGRERSKSREPSYSRSKSRENRSYSKNRTPSPRNHRGKSESRERSRSRDRSSPRRGSPRRSPKMNDNMSRSVSPA